MQIDGTALRGVRLARVPRDVRQNLLFSFVYNTMGVAVAAGGLHPAFGANPCLRNGREPLLRLGDRQRPSA